MSASKKRILIVDDDPDIRGSLSLLLSNSFAVVTAEDGIEGIEKLGAAHPDLILLDVAMPRLSGLDTLRRIREQGCEAPVLMITGNTTLRIAVEAMKQGATDYLSKPFDIEELTSLILSALERDSDRSKKAGSGEPLSPHGDGDCGQMVGKSPIMCQVYHDINRLAQWDTTVLVVGESGTGKELIARAIHDLSERRGGPFVALNCAAMPEGLIESELFGHERGAFTSAVEKRLGLAEAAHGGTLFLDEIGELSLVVQAKLLRFLQEREFYRVGRNKPIKVDVRIITATNRDLEELVRENKFRLDLFYRINVATIISPPLRQRADDVPLLIENFARKFAPRYGSRQLRLSTQALDVLQNYQWPGNVRELENLVEQLLVLAPKEGVSVDDLPQRMRRPLTLDVLRDEHAPLTQTFEEAQAQFEREMILKALQRSGFVQTRAAEILGMTRRMLKYKMDRLGLSAADAPHK